jgi:hypothetical protein
MKWLGLQPLPVTNDDVISGAAEKEVLRLIGLYPASVW